MTFRACLVDKIDAKHARRAQAEAVLEQYDSRVKELMDGGMPVERADMAAGEEITTQATEVNKWAKAQRVQQARVQVALAKRIDSANARPGKVLSEIFAEIERVGRGNLSHFHPMMVGFLEKYDTKFLGNMRKTADLDKVLRELYGQDSGSPASKEFANAIRQLYETTTKMARANGVNMANDPKFHAPQFHDKGRMSRAGQAKWVDDHNQADVLDWDEMKHFNDGKVIAPEDRVRVLNEVFDTLTQGGMNKIAHGVTGNVSVGARLTQKRFLRYKTPEAWERMQGEYGNGSLAEQMIEYMNSMSRDLAQLQVLGPNPGTTKIAMEQLTRSRASQLNAEKRGTKAAEREINAVERDINSANDIYGLVTGRNSNLDDSVTSLIFSGVRTTLAGALLGKAVLSALPGDLTTMKHMAMFSGHKSMAPVSRYMRLLNPANKADRDFAARSGMIQELVIGGMSSAERFGGDPFGPKWVRRVSETALRATGLTQHTHWARVATSLELMGSYADHAGKAFDELPFKEGLERVGFTKEDWDVFRATALADHQGAKFLRPRDLLLRDDLDLAEGQDIFAKLSAYEGDILELAVPTASVEAKAKLLGGTTGGTIAGELTRSFAMFKNFPITIMMKHWRDAMRQATPWQKTKYMMTFMGGLTAAGALSEQLHALSKGEDLHNMNPIENPLFWAKAMARGGGLSLFADFIVSDSTRYGQGFFSNLLGPSAALGDAAAKASHGQVLKAMRGDDTDAVSHIARLLRQYSPGSHTWYLDRVITALTNEFIFEEIDPRFHQKARRKSNKLRVDEGRGSWWGDDLLPERAPDIETIFQ